MTSKIMRMKAPTAADVAREAKVSKAQAARALGGYGAVSDEVMTRVLAAAERLGYRPNELARSMNTGRSNTLGVIVGDIENPHFGLALRGISDVARQAGYHVILSNSDEQVSIEQEAVRVMLEKRVDGIIVAPSSSAASDNAHLTQVLTEGRALTLFDRAVYDLNVEVIGVDFTRSAQQATQELLEAGHRRIAYVTSMNSSEPYRRPEDMGLTPVAQRIAGMERAFSVAAVPFIPALIKPNALDDAAVARIVGELFDDAAPPTAVIASDSLIAQALLREFHLRGLRIPQDLSFVMYDNFPWTEIVSPPLSVIAQPVYEMGCEAARRIIAQIRGEEPGPMPQFETRYLRRGSTGPAPL
ncbi:LacI family transcriptional regulator [Pantoea alhagi]|uniref:LacI family transcriptional regulator n=1 Tax=Pantoea alhagi TaxID=1891675 RepID=A0A1W6B2I4_9GAMM|nr:LacI family DNA-binding transcriptional regulator [Pantoea alhagi]ARJ41301.1 LacI family transcriptional regulator [Pantoea alhagi]